VELRAFRAGAHIIITSFTPQPDAIDVLQTPEPGSSVTGKPMRSVRQALPAAVFVALLVAVCVNALLYAVKAANPLIAADGWHAVDTVVRAAANGELSVGDLFGKRGAFDHSQPLRKLILLFHYRWFDLDFGIEAIIGVLAAFANLGVMWLVVLAGRPDAARRTDVLLGFAALAAVYLSLNAVVTFNWPLLTLNYTSHLFVLLFLCTAWLGYRRPSALRLAALFAAAATMDVVADDTGLIATVAAVMAVGLFAWRERRLRAGVQACLAMAVALIAYRVGYAWLQAGVPLAGGGEGLASASLSGLAEHAGEAWDWIAVPLVAPLVHRMQLREWLGADIGAVSAVLALALLAAHAWFWWRALAGRSNLTSFVATSLMLLFYGLLAGIILVRVSRYGSEYLWQPRYALIYAWHLVALLLMAISQVGDRAAPATAAGRAGRPALAVVACMLLLLQVPLSLHTWQGLRYLSAYQQRMAATLGAIARDPAATPKACAPQLVICRYDEQRRRQMIRFLQANRLSVFSASFRARNRLYTGAEALPR
jgi:hypothetical protein